jgi:hypothetical protein
VDSVTIDRNLDTPAHARSAVSFSGLLNAIDGACAEVCFSIDESMSITLIDVAPGWSYALHDDQSCGETRSSFDSPRPLRLARAL